MASSANELKSPQVVNVYRSKLRNDLSGPDGDEVARQRVEDYANRMRPAGFLVSTLSPRTIHSYVTKNPHSALKAAFPQTFEIEISYADELEEILTDELWELGHDLESDNPRWWILKPSAHMFFQRARGR
jgi:hypothetical protein